MFTDMTQVKLESCNYLNTCKEMTTEYAIQSGSNEFQNVCFKNRNTFKETNFTVKFISSIGEKELLKKL